jgi:hypothetical protein
VALGVFGICVVVSGAQRAQHDRHNIIVRSGVFEFFQDQPNIINNNLFFISSFCGCQTLFEHFGKKSTNASISCRIFQRSFGACGPNVPGGASPYALLAAISGVHGPLTRKD